MGLTMGERKAVTREASKRYGRARKKEKGRMLDEFCALTGYNRCYGARVLRASGRAIGKAGKGRERRGRLKRYGPEVLGPLKKVWTVSDGMCGKRLAAIMPEMIRKLERFGEIRLGRDVRALLMVMSAATIDRLLVSERRKMQLKGSSGTKPGSLLKSQIPIRTFSEWDERMPGVLEVDLVARDGGDVRGEFSYEEYLKEHGRRISVRANPLCEGTPSASGNPAGAGVENSLFDLRQAGPPACEDRPSSLPF